MVRGEEEEEGKGEESGAAAIGATACDACAGPGMYVVGWRQD